MRNKLPRHGAHIYADVAAMSVTEISEIIDSETGSRGPRAHEIRADRVQAVLSLKGSVNHTLDTHYCDQYLLVIVLLVLLFSYDVV
jgi:hypothetical protein